MSWLLLWRGKGTAPALSPSGVYLGYERSGAVIVENIIKKEEIYRHPQGMDPQWWRDEECAFRIAGQPFFWVVDVVTRETQRMYPAPGAVFLCKNGHWCTWVKKQGTLWVDGKVLREGASRPLQLTDDGDVLFEARSMDPAALPPEEGIVRTEWVQTSAGLVVVALELPGKRLKVYVEEPQ